MKKYIKSIIKYILSLWVAMAVIFAFDMLLVWLIPLRGPILTLIIAVVTCVLLILSALIVYVAWSFGGQEGQRQNGG